ncbi:HD-GYP domain-containing protein [Lentibacillus salinarum]|uniref:HD-GYP domain-containing protein n=1 Tax=Lentibacillus salinarum TaxID=446820 RepID=A0ABW3ZW62_9BACI
MRVEPSQLAPGCVLLKDVKGKTTKPIIPEKTVLTEEHITVLHKFLVATVDVSATLADGRPFNPEAANEAKRTASTEWIASRSFAKQYQDAVDDYKKLFKNWQHYAMVDIADVRQVLIPLFESIDHVGLAVYTLDQYATSTDYVYHHSVSVGILAAFLAKQLGYEKGEWLQVGLAGALSDCGMARVDETLMTKDKPLNRSELDDIRKHPVYSYRMIEKAAALTQVVKLAVLQHHERLDGSGYPLGLEKDNIHRYSRIIAVCDMYHAMTCERFYQKKQSPFAAIKKLQHDHFTKLDHHIVQVFIDGFVHLSSDASANS